MLVWGEQGLGDEILYCRMAAEIGPDTCGVTLEMDHRLVPLFSRTFPEIAVVARRDPPVLDPGAFDQIVPAASLGQWLRPAFKSFPGKPVPLKADPDRVSAYGRALRTSAPGMHGVVGLSWRSANPEYGSEKSAQLVDWGEIMTAPGASFVNLQYGNVDAELGRAEESCGRRIRGIPGLDLFDDIDGVAALASACDLVITTSNVTAHIAGALGRPVWVILPLRLGRIWYWFLDREDSPWYPSMRLFSQKTDGVWNDVISDVARELRVWLAGRATP